MKRFLFTAAVTTSIVVGGALGPMPVFAQVFVYYGVDYGAVDGGPRPQSTAAAASFDAAASSAGALRLVDFESSPIVLFNNYSPVTGMTITASNQAQILNAPTDSQSNYAGFNTTVGGTKYNKINGGSETFTFATPIVGFGAYVTGVQNNATYTFTDGASQTISFASLFSVGIFGGSIFVGFIDPGKTINSVTLTIANQLGVPDGAGIDDIRFITAVPETSTAGMILTGLVGLSLMRRVRGSAVAAFYLPSEGS